MLEFGVNNPILVDSKGGIVAGHGRLLAARKLGLSSVPVVVLDHLSEAQRRAYILADNRLAELAGWDTDLLASELAELAGDFDLGMMGFDDTELQKLLGAPDESDDESAPDKTELDSRLLRSLKVNTELENSFNDGCHCRKSGSFVYCSNLGEYTIVCTVIPGRE